MRLLLILSILFSSFLQAKNAKPIINECMSDIYFANGILTTKDEASDHLEFRLKQKVINNLYQGDAVIANKHHTFKLAYNYSFKKDFGETAGGVLDVLEAYEQLQNTSVGWEVFGIIAGFAVEHVLVGPKLTSKFAQYLVSKGMPEVMAEYIAEEIATETLLQLYDLILGNKLEAQHDNDLSEQIAQYQETFALGHAAIVVAHSQGNLFTIEANEAMPWWSDLYYYHISVATPATKLAGTKGVHFTFQNDPIKNILGALGWNVTNHIAYTGEVMATGEAIYDEPTAFHGFEYYMGEQVVYNAKPYQTNNARDKIFESVKSAIERHKTAPSQWEKDKEFGCACDKRISLKHAFDSTLDANMSGIKVLSFNDYQKLYPVGEEYIKGPCGGESIEKSSEKNICFDLKDEKSKVLSQTIGLEEKYTKQSGVVEVALSWDRPELNYDLKVEWDAGEVDVKDVCDPYEHFHIKSERQIFPGRYGISIAYAQEPGEDINDSIFPFDVNLTIFTPGASDKMQFTVKSKADLNIGHVSDIKVYRLDDDDDDSNSSSSGSSSSEGGNQNPDAPRPFIFLPVQAPDCPPVKYTPSPTPHRPVYFSSGGGGGSGWSGSGGGSGAWYIVSGGSSGGSSDSGSSSHVKPLNTNHSCAGDVTCLPTPNNFHNPNVGDYTQQPLLPLPPSAGGEPVRNLDEEDNCTGDYSCACIPCEYEIIPHLKQVYFGPLRNAAYRIYTLDSYANGSAFYNGVTTNGATLYDSGELNIPDALLQTFDDDKLYIIEVSGGEDIDANDDFIVDAVPTPNQGKAYAIASGADLKYTGLKVNILTTVTFTLVQEMILSGADKEEINTMISKLASRLLRYKVYPKQDEAISNVDLLAWLPTVDKDLLLHAYDPLEAMVQKIYAGEDIYDDAYNYLFFVPAPATSQPLPVDKPIADMSKPPIIKGISARIDENASGGTVVGTIEILRGSEDVTFGALSGPGHEKFDVDASGTVWLREGESLDYETKWLYKLKVEAFNAKGGSGQVGVYISVVNITDAPEFEDFEGGEIAEDAAAGTVVGTLHFNEGASPITSIELKGTYADLFEVDTHGVIRLKQSNTLDYETLYAYGFVVLAHNDQGVSMPIMLYINVINVPDIPIFQDYTGGYIHEDASTGERVGQVQFDKGGSEVSAIRLEGVGAENFTIDLDGVIRVADGAVLDYESTAVYRPSVIMTNSYGDSKAANIFIVLTDAKDVPSFVGFSGGNVKENSPVGTIVGTITYEHGAAPIESITLSGNGSNLFQVLENGTIIVAKEGLDYEKQNYYPLKAIAHNSFGDSLTLTLNIYVDDVAETPVVLEDFVINDLLDNTEVGHAIGHITVLNIGSSPVELYEVSGSNSDHFKVDVNGTVRLNYPLDATKQEVYNLHVRAKNGAGFGNKVNLIVRIVDHSKYAPTLHDIDVYFDKNAPAGSVVGNILSSNGQAQIMEITLDPDTPFAAKPNGDIIIDSSLASTTQTFYTLNATARNEFGDSNTVTVTLRVILPPKIMPISTKVFDGLKSGTAIGNIKIVENGTKIHSMKLIGEGNNDFVLDYNRSINVAPGITLDAEKKSLYELKIVVNGIYEANATIDVMDDIVGKVVSLPDVTDVEVFHNSDKALMISGSYLSLLNTSDPFDPYMTVNKALKCEFATARFSKNGDKIVVSNDICGFTIFDSSDLYSLTQLGTIAFYSEDAYHEPFVVGDTGFSKDETIAYIDAGGVKIVDISDPTSPQIIDSLDSYRVEVSPDGQFLYTLKNTWYANNIQILDLTNPRKPTQVATLVLAGGNDSLRSLKLSPDGTLLFASRSREITIIDVSDPYKPSILSTISVPDAFDNYYSIVSDSKELLTVLAGNLQLIDISDPYHPTVLKTVKIPDNAGWSMTASPIKEYVYVGSESLYIVDIQTEIPEKRPRIVDTNIAVEENTPVGLVVGAVKPWYTGSAGLTSLTLSGEGSEDFAIDLDGNVTLINPLNYYNKKSYELNATATNAQGSREAVLSIRVHAIPEITDLNLSVNNSMHGGSKIGTLDMWVDNNNTLSSIELTGSNAEYFVVNTSGAIFVAEGVELHHYMIPEFTLGVIATNQYGSSEQATINIHVSPIYTTSEVMPTQEKVTTSLDGTKRFEANGYSGLRVVDITDTNATYVINTINTLGYVYDVTLSEERQQAYVVASNYFYVVDVSDISHLTVLETIRLDSNGKSIFLSQDGSSAVILTQDGTYTIIDLFGSINTPDKKPGLFGFDAVINYQTAVGEVVGQAEIVYKGKNGLTSVSLQGEDANDFSIDFNGIIKVAQSFDYKRRWVYELTAIATNEMGSTEVPINIILESTPKFDTAEFFIEENLPLGAVIGAIEHWDGGHQIDSITLTGEGSDRFAINTDGTLSVVALDHEGQGEYKLLVSATNALGQSEPSSVTIHVSDLFKTIKIDENISEGTVVGYIDFSKGETITSVILSGSGSKYFSINTDGRISVVDATGIDYETLSAFNLTAIATNEYGTSKSVDVNITIQNIIDPPTLYDTTLHVDEHSPIGTVVGQIQISEQQDCAITSFSVNPLYAPTNYSFDIDIQGVVSIISNKKDLDYEYYSAWRYLDVTAISECGESNTARLLIGVNDLDENAEVGFGIMPYGYATIYQIEQNGSLTQQYHEYVFRNNDRAIFNTHKYELDPDAYYLMEATNGSELDIDSNGIIEWTNRFEFRGKMRAIVKGSWLFEVPTIRLSPMSEMLVDAIDLQAEKYEIGTLETRIDETVQKIVRTDIDGDGEITVFDALQYNTANVYDPYVFLGDLEMAINGGTDIGTAIDAVQMLDIHGGTAVSLELVGEGSQYFELGAGNSLTVSSSLFDQAGNAFEFALVATDENNVTSMGDIKITVAPPMYLLSSYTPGGFVNKIEATKDGKLLFAAAGEAGVVILDIQNPDSPQPIAQFIDEIDTYENGINVTSLALSHDGKTLYVTEAIQSRLLILDVSDPTNYHQISVLPIASSEYGLREVFVSADDQYVYVAGDMLETIDVTNKSNLQVLSRFDMFSKIWGYIYGLELSPDATKVSVVFNEYEFTASYSVNVSNPNVPISVEPIDYQDYVHMVRKGTIGFSTQLRQNIKVLDLEKLDEWGYAHTIMDFETPGYKQNIAISGDEAYLYVSCGEDGIQIIGFHEIAY